MEVVTGAMSTLLPKMGDLLKEEYELQKGVRGEIMFLEAELESMQAALLKVSEASINQPPDIQVKLWARDVKDLSYDVEDTIDVFMVRVGTRAPNNLHSPRDFINRSINLHSLRDCINRMINLHSLWDFINRSINLLTMAHVRHKIGTDIKGIKRRIMEVSERRVRNKVDNVVAKPVGPTIDSFRLSALYKKATELVGMEEKSNGLIKRLMEGDEASKQQLKIVSIVGFGGLGKTTLANVVYQKLKEQFDCSAFISVSLNPNMEKIFKNMLHQLGKHSNIDDEAQLINELRDFLRNKRDKTRLGRAGRASRLPVAHMDQCTEVATLCLARIMYKTWSKILQCEKQSNHSVSLLASCTKLIRRTLLVNSNVMKTLATTSRCKMTPYVYYREKQK